MEDIPLGIVTNLLSEFLIVVIGVLFAQFIKSRWDNWRYGNWQVVVKDLDQVDHARPISAKKAKQILEMPEDLSVYLKGVASAYGWINVDLITEGRDIELLKEDRSNKRFVIDMQKNPPAAQKREGTR